jgi:hypothetical protein
MHGKTDNISSVKNNITMDDFARRFRDKAHDRLGGYAFATAGLPHNTEHLAPVNGKTHIINCFCNALKRVKVGLERFNLKEVSGVGHNIISN